LIESVKPLRLEDQLGRWDRQVDFVAVPLTDHQLHGDEGHHYDEEDECLESFPLDEPPGPRQWIPVIIAGPDEFWWKDFFTRQRGNARGLELPQDHLQRSLFLHRPGRFRIDH